MQTNIKHTFYKQKSCFVGRQLQAMEEEVVHTIKNVQKGYSRTKVFWERLRMATVSTAYKEKMEIKVNLPSTLLAVQTKEFLLFHPIKPEANFGKTHFSCTEALDGTE